MILRRFPTRSDGSWILWNDRSGVLRAITAVYGWRSRESDRRDACQFQACRSIDRAGSPASEGGEARSCLRRWQTQLRADAIAASSGGSLHRRICRQSAGRHRGSGPLRARNRLSRMVGRLLFPAAATPAPMTGETGISPHAHIDPSARVEAGVDRRSRRGHRPRRCYRQRHRHCPPCRYRSLLPVRPRRLCRSRRQHPVRADRQPRHHPWRRPHRPGRFWLRRRRQGPERVPQIGRVVIQDDVEIGSNTTVDRGAMSDTIIGKAPRSTIWSRSLITSASAAIA